MIGYLQGKVLYSDGKKATLLTESGIGYEINYGYFLQTSTDIGLYIHHHVSENDQSLWGFNNIEDKKMFELLKTVNKVGSSKAYPLITNIGTRGLVDAITFEQSEVLTQAPGIGKKMAEQIILSLKDKTEKLEAFSSVASESKIDKNINKLDTEQADDTANFVIDTNLLKETVQALESLGYKDKDVMKLVQQNMDESVSTSEDLLKRVLREL